MSDSTQQPLDGSDASKFRAIFDAAVDAILTIDEFGIVSTLNPAAERMFGYSARELIGENVKVLMPSPYHDEHDGYLARFRATGEKRIIGIGREVTGRRKDGSDFPMYLSVAEASADSGRIFVGIVRDVSVQAELKLAQERLISELEQKNAELERFTYTVSHDLKSPLITIKGFLGSIEKDARTGNFERLQSDVARIGRAADQMKELLDDLLELSRIGRMVNVPQNVPLAGVIADVVELLAGTISEQQAVVDVARDLPTVHGDRTRIGEVFQNLLENALKFAEPGVPPRIEVGVSQSHDGFATCFVRDHGIGVDPRYVDKVFGLFERLDHRGSGTGIGLALTKRIVEHHGGRVWIESDGIGRGAVVRFTLPLASTQGDNAPGEGREES